MTGNFEMYNVHGTFVGVGPGAKGTISSGSTPDATAEILAGLAELRRLLAEHADALDDRERAEAAVAGAVAEVDSERPQKAVLQTFLDRITGAAAGVTAVTGAVGAVRELLGGLP